jgi:hypothetical protein
MAKDWKSFPVRPVTRLQDHFHHFYPVLYWNLTIAIRQEKERKLTNIICLQMI